MDKAQAMLDFKSAATDLADLGLKFSINLVTAIAILIAGWFLARLLSRWLKGRLEKIEEFDRTLIPVLGQIAHYAVLIVTIILVLSQFGVQTASMIAVLGAAGLAIGLAVQGTLQNVASGLMLLMIRPFHVGDYIEAGGAGGTVDQIGLFMTRMHTPQNVFIAVPNSKIFSDTIVNYSTFPNRRMDLLVGISYDDDIDRAVQVLWDVLGADKRFLKRPKPKIIVKSLGDSSVNLEIRAWTKRAAFWDVQFDTVRAVKYALDQAGISIPYPHTQIIVSRASDGSTAPQDKLAA